MRGELSGGGGDFSFHFPVFVDQWVVSAFTKTGTDSLSYFVSHLSGW